MFIPKKSDKIWMQNLLNMLKDGAIWGTDWAVYKKVDKDTLEVVNRNPNIPSVKVEENIERVGIMMKSIGKKLIDKDKK